MNDLPSKTESPIEPQSTTGEKPSIRKAQEEFIGDEAQPSMDKSEYERQSAGSQSAGAAPKKDASEQTPAASDGSNTIKDPDTWTTGDEPATGAQMSYLKTLASETKFELDEGQRITKAEASKLIDELRHKSGRVQDAG